LIDATTIEALPSTQNAEKARDPEPHQTKKDSEWHFGMKVGTGVAVRSPTLLRPAARHREF